MVATIDQILRIGSTGYRLFFSSDQPDPVTFYVFVDGQQVSATQQTSYDVQVLPGEAPLIDVVDSLAAAPQSRLAPNIQLQWFESDTAVLYRVEEFISGQWVTIKEYFATGQGYYHHLTRTRPDVTAYEFRVLALDELSNESGSVSLPIFLVRHPDPPNLTFSVSSGGGSTTVTIDQG